MDEQDDDREPSEAEAIATGLLLVAGYKTTPGLEGTDFDKGMRALQAALRRASLRHAPCIGEPGAARLIKKLRAHQKNKRTAH